MMDLQYKKYNNLTQSAFNTISTEQLKGRQESAMLAVLHSQRNPGIYH